MADQVLSPAASAVEPSPMAQANEIIENQSANPTTDANNESAKTAEPPKPAEKARLKKLKLKVDQKEYEEDLPFEFEDSPEVVDYLTKKLQLANVSQKRMSEYSQLEKEVGQFLQDLKKDPRKALSNPHIGVDLKELARSVIEEEIANAQKSPEQLQREKLEQELQRIKDEREKEKEENSQKELSRLQEQEYERYDMLMTQALEKSDLPKSPYVIKKMADYMLLGLQNKIDVTPADVIPLVRDEMTNDLKEMFAVMPDEVIENIIGKDVLNRIRKRKVAEVKSPTNLPNKKLADTSKSGNTPAKSSDKKVNYKDFFGI